MPYVECKPFTPQREALGFKLSPELKVGVVSQPILPTLMWSPSRLLDVKGLLHQFLVLAFFFLQRKLLFNNYMDNQRYVE